MSVPSNTRIAPWEDFVLRIIAIYKLLHATFFTAVGLGLLRLRGHNVPEFLHTYIIIPYHLPEDRLINWLLDEADTLTSHKLLLLGYAAFFYAALFAAEGIGLYLRKHWAEYLVAIVTGSLLPIEAWEVFHRPVWWKFVVIAGNLLIVAYLVHRIMLDARTKARQIRANPEKSAPSSTTVQAKPVVGEVRR